MNKTIIAISSFIVVIIIVGVVFVYMPASKEMGVLREQFNRLEERERNNVSELQVREIRRAVDSLYASIDEGMKRIYPEEQLLDLGRAVENIGKEYGLELISIVPDYESLSLFTEATEDISELPMLIEFQGGFDQLTQFLDGIPEFPFVLKINEVNIERMEQDSIDLWIQLRGVIVLKKERSNEGEKENEQVIKTGLI